MKGVLGQCTVCSRLFAAESMADLMQCRTCHDRKALRDVRNWTELDPESIQEFLQSTDRPDIEVCQYSDYPATP
jgi:hypothetical protein